MTTTADRLLSVKEYYFSKKLREVAQLMKEGKPIISLGIGSPDLPPHPTVLEALQASLTEPMAHAYKSYQGIPELRGAIAKFYDKQFAVDLDSNTEILPLMGSKEGIMHISMAFLNKGDQVLIPNPGYPTYASVSRLVEAEPVFYDLNAEKQWMPDFEALEKQDLSKVKLMWVNYPHMPTGQNATDDIYKKLIAFGLKHNILIVNDNPYSFVLNNSPKSIMSIEGAKATAIELNSLSKTFNMAGWRVGMVVGNKSVLNEILKVKSNMDSGMFYGIQKGAIKALELERTWYDELNTVYGKRRDLVYQILDLLKCKYDRNAVGMFVWAKVPAGETGTSLSDYLLYEKNIFATPGMVFGSNGTNYIRMSLCINETSLKEVINRLA